MYNIIIIIYDKSFSLFIVGNGRRINKRDAFLTDIILLKLILPT